MGRIVSGNVVLPRQRALIKSDVRSVLLSLLRRDTLQVLLNGVFKRTRPYLRRTLPSLRSVSTRIHRPQTAGPVQGDTRYRGGRLVRNLSLNRLKVQRPNPV